jgi:hypothetical protein
MCASMWALAIVRLEGEYLVAHILDVESTSVPDDLGLSASEVQNVLIHNEPKWHYAATTTYQQLLSVNTLWLRGFLEGNAVIGGPPKNIEPIVGPLVRMQELGFLIVRAQTHRQQTCAIDGGRRWEDRSFVDFMAWTGEGGVDPTAFKKFRGALQDHIAINSKIYGAGDHNPQPGSVRNGFTFREPGGFVVDDEGNPTVPREVALHRRQEANTQDWMGAGDPETFHPNQIDTFDCFDDIGCPVLAGMKPWEVLATTCQFQMSPRFSLEEEIIRMAEEAGIQKMWTPCPRELAALLDRGESVEKSTEAKVRSPTLG